MLDLANVVLVTVLRQIVLAHVRIPRDLNGTLRDSVIDCIHIFLMAGPDRAQVQSRVAMLFALVLIENVNGSLSCYHAVIGKFIDMLKRAHEHSSDYFLCSNRVFESFLVQQRRLRLAI